VAPQSTRYRLSDSDCQSLYWQLHHFSKHPSFSIFFLNTGNSARHQTILMRSDKQCPKDTLSLSLPSLSVLTAIFQVNLDHPVLLELKMMEVVVTTGAIRRVKPQSNHYHPTFYRPNALPVAKPMASKH